MDNHDLRLTNSSGEDIENMRHPIPLTEQPWSGRVIASWAVVGVSALGLVVVLVKVLA